MIDRDGIFRLMTNAAWFEDQEGHEPELEDFDRLDRQQIYALAEIEPRPKQDFLNFALEMARRWSTPNGCGIGSGGNG